MIPYLLFLLCRTGNIFTMPFGILYTVIRRIRRRRHTLGTYFYNISLAYDRLVNAIHGDFLNDTLRQEGGYDYGDPDDTISKVTGINKKIHKQKKLGVRLANFLNRIDKNHVEKAAEK